MAKGQRYNPHEHPKFAPFFPAKITGERTDDQGRVSYTTDSGMPQTEYVHGILRRNWITPKKGTRIEGKPETLNPKPSKKPRYLFAGMWKTPKGVGYYGGNKRMPNGEWMIRVRWDERDISAGYMDFPLRRRNKRGSWIHFITPIFTAPNGGKIKHVWREQGHMKTKGPEMPEMVLEEVEAEPGPPAIGLRVTHVSHGPGIVESVSTYAGKWYTQVRYDNQSPRREVSPYGPLLEDAPHEYGVPSFYGGFFNVKKPKGKRILRIRKTTPDTRGIQERFEQNPGASAVAVEDGRARLDRDLTEFVVGGDGKVRRRTVSHKPRAMPKANSTSNGTLPSTFLREAGIGTEWD